MHVKLVMLENGQRGRTIRIRRPEIIIGRAKGCKVRIASSDVSRQHCRLRIAGTTVVIQDLGSSNGTLLNGQLCQGEKALRPYDRLQVGPVTFLVEFDAATEPMPAIPMDEAELNTEAEDIIILDVEEVEVDPFRMTRPPAPARKTRHAPQPVRSDVDWVDQAAASVPPTKPEEPLPWAELAESSLPPPAEQLPVAEPDESQIAVESAAAARTTLLELSPAALLDCEFVEGPDTEDIWAVQGWQAFLAVGNRAKDHHDYDAAEEASRLLDQIERQLKGKHTVVCVWRGLLAGATDGPDTARKSWAAGLVDHPRRAMLAELIGVSFLEQGFIVRGQAWAMLSARLGSSNPWLTRSENTCWLYLAYLAELAGWEALAQSLFSEADIRKGTRLIPEEVNQLHRAWRALAESAREECRQLFRSFASRVRVLPPDFLPPGQDRYLKLNYLIRDDLFSPKLRITVSEPQAVPRPPHIAPPEPPQPQSRPQSVKLSDTLPGLLAQLQRIPEPQITEEQAQSTDRQHVRGPFALFSAKQVGAILLSQVQIMDASRGLIPFDLERVDDTKSTIDTVAEALGEEHLAVRILRKMLHMVEAKYGG
jgi:pSer/pThr/pTyr-binding forkhead associated (FHA) protein